MTHDAAVVINVTIREESGVYYANSADLIGLHVCGNDVEQTCQRVLKSIKAIFKHSRNIDVEVMPATDMETYPAVKVPCGQFVVHRLAA